MNRPRWERSGNDLRAVAASASANRVTRGVALLVAVTVVSTVAYIAVGLDPFEALYQTVITISTVGFREIGQPDDTPYRIVTVVVVLLGVGTAFYTLGVLLETLVEGRLTDQIWRRRMERTVQDMTDHVIVCGWGRVGSTIARSVAANGRSVVIVDREAERLVDVDLPFVQGDATDDAVLETAGIHRAYALVAALDSDAPNLYVTLSGRSLRRDLFIVARAHLADAESKLARAGADRVVNPQHIGGERIAAMLLQPTVTDFLDVVMHDSDLEFRLEEIRVDDASPLAGATLRDAHLRQQTGALVLAMRDREGNFRTNPSPDTTIAPNEVLVAIGTPDQLQKLRQLLGPGS